MNTVEYLFHLIPKLEKESPTLQPQKIKRTESPTPKKCSMNSHGGLSENVGLIFPMK